MVLLVWSCEVRLGKKNLTCLSSIPSNSVVGANAILPTSTECLETAKSSKNGMLFGRLNSWPLNQGPSNTAETVEKVQITRSTPYKFPRPRFFRYL